MIILPPPPPPQPLPPTARRGRHTVVAAAAGGVGAGGGAGARGGGGSPQARRARQAAAAGRAGTCSPAQACFRNAKGGDLSAPALPPCHRPHQAPRRLPLFPPTAVPQLLGRYIERHGAAEGFGVLLGDTSGEAWCACQQGRLSPCRPCTLNGPSGAEPLQAELAAALQAPLPAARAAAAARPPAPPPPPSQPTTAVPPPPPLPSGQVPGERGGHGLAGAARA